MTKENITVARKLAAGGNARGIAPDIIKLAVQRALDALSPEEVAAANSGDGIIETASDQVSTSIKKAKLLLEEKYQQSREAAALDLDI